MRTVTETMVAVFRYIMWFMLFVVALFLILFAFRYRVMINNQSRVMAYTDTIAAYIQKNGGLTLPNGTSEQEFFRNIARANNVEEMVCPERDCLTTIEVDDTTNKGQNRSRIYTVTTRYALIMPTVPWYTESRGATGIRKGPDQTRPIISRAYVTEYRNY